MSALVSIVSNLVPSVAISLPSTVPETVILDDTSRELPTFVSPFKLIVRVLLLEEVGPILTVVEVLDAYPVPILTIFVLPAFPIPVE